MKKTSTGVEQQWRKTMGAGSRCAQTGDIEGALQAFDSAVKQCPDRIEGWINLGSMLVECKQFKAAVNVMSKAIRLQPEHMLAHMIMGDAQRLIGQRDLAHKCYEQSVALKRAPVALNRLACMLREMMEPEGAQSLFDEALEKDPNFILARVNRATLEISRRNYDEAHSQLEALTKLNLPPSEAKEVFSALTALSEFHRLRNLIDPLTLDSELTSLENALRELPENARAVDLVALETIGNYLKQLPNAKPTVCALDVELPDDWALIEAMHMIPYVHSAREYVQFQSAPSLDDDYNSALHQSVNMEAAAIASRSSKDAMGDPVLAEARIRHWHKLAVQDVKGFQPGHFKYIRNLDYRNPTLPMVDPAAATATFQFAIKNVYDVAPPGIVRATLVFLVVADLHAFGDGNGRVGMIWLNRELEWAGEMPALFAEHLGAKGGFGKALYEVRTNGGDLTPMFEAIRAAQEYAKVFCTELSSLR